MRVFVWTVLSVVLLAVSPAMAAMNHAPMAEYSDRVFLSGMIAHHEGAVAMAERLLKTPEKELNPQVVKWAKEIMAAQNKEVEEMKELLKSAGGMDEAAYKDMEKGMRAMMDAKNQNANPNIRFVEEMVPHHAQALEMAIPALQFSKNPHVIDLAQTIIISQTKEIHALRTWLLDQTK